MEQEDKINEILDLVRYNHKVLKGERRKRQIKSILILTVSIILITVALIWYSKNKENISIFLSSINEKAEQTRNLIDEGNRLLNIVR